MNTSMHATGMTIVTSLFDDCLWLIMQQPVVATVAVEAAAVTVEAAAVTVEAAIKKIKIL